MQMEPKPNMRKLVLALDAMALMASILLSYLLHIALQDQIDLLKDPPTLREYLRIIVFVVPTWLIIISMKGLDQVFEARWTRRWLLWRLTQVQAIGFITLFTILYLTQIVINRSLIGLFSVCSFMLLYLVRVAIQLRLERRGKGLGRVRVIVAGAWTPAMEDFLGRTAKTPHPPIIAGRLGPEDHSGDTSVPFLGPLDGIAEVIHNEVVDVVLFFEPYRQPDDTPDALESCERVGITTGFHVEAVHRPRSVPRISALFDSSFVLYEVSPKSPTALTIKHIGDLVGAALITALATPVLLVVATLIRIRMGSPIIFSQERAGLNGRVFRMYKFRTMVADAADRREELVEKNEMSGPVFKVTDDERITPLGRFLRKWSVDELPQLFNVLQGSMSLVGPRPLPTYEQERIRGDQRRRLSMRPGITGLWQVSGRSDIDFDEWMELDLRYIDEWRLSGDLLILIRTAGVVLLRKGAK